MVEDVSWHVRSAVPADLPGLVSLEQACFAIPWSEESLRYDLCDHPAAHYFVADAPDGSLAGYAAFWQALDEAQITNVAVAPAWRRRGLGRLLLQALIGKASELALETLFLEVRSSNRPAIALYESAGFKSVGLRRAYYSDNGEDAIIMLKNIG